MSSSPTPRRAFRPLFAATGTLVPPSFSASAAEPPLAARGGVVAMEKILNPFRFHLTSARPWVVPAAAAGQAGQTAPAAVAAEPDGRTAGVSAGGAASRTGVSLDIDVPAISVGVGVVAPSGL